MPAKCQFFLKVFPRPLNSPGSPKETPMQLSAHRVHVCAPYLVNLLHATVLLACKTVLSLVIRSHADLLIHHDRRRVVCVRADKNMNLPSELNTTRQFRRTVGLVERPLLQRWYEIGQGVFKLVALPHESCGLKIKSLHCTESVFLQHGCTEVAFPSNKTKLACKCCCTVTTHACRAARQEFTAVFAYLYPVVFGGTVSSVGHVNGLQR